MVGGVPIVQCNKATISLNLLLILAVWVKCSPTIPSTIAFHMDVCRDGGAAAWWLNVRTHNTEVVSSSPVGVTIKMPLVRKLTGYHFIKPTSLEKTLSPVSSFCFARNRVCD